MYTLYIDTHNNKITIVIYKDEKVLIKKEVSTVYKHSITTMPVIVQAMQDANIGVFKLKEIIVVNGPGSFTGVRIGVTIAKTFAYCLNIPIKAISSLFIKASSFVHDDVTIIEREKNGVFLGKFNAQNELIEDYKYVKNSEYELIKKPDFMEDVELNYEQIKKNCKNIKAQNPHAINPLYIKKIEVEK